MPLRFPSISVPPKKESEVASFLQLCRDGQLVQLQDVIATKSPSREVLAWGLHAAASAGHASVMRCLLDSGAEIMTFTVYAAKSRAALEALMDYGLEVNHPMPSAVVPVISVAVKNDPALLEWFLSLGANPNLGPPDVRAKGSIEPDEPPTPTSGSALEQSARFSSHAIIDILVSHGAKLENSLAVHHALYREEPGERIPMMDHLLKLGMPVNKLGYMPTIPHGGTALHIAAGLGLEDEVVWLLEHGADPRIAGNFNMTPAAQALLGYHGDLAKLLDKWTSRLMREEASQHQAP